MKKYRFFLIIIIFVILLMFFALMIIRTRESVQTPGPKDNSEKSATQSVKAQSYLTNKIPSLKNEDRVFGDKNAPVKIFVYEDNSSIFSARLADVLDRLNADFPMKIAIIVRPFIAKNSDLAKEAALAVDCAGKQNKWLEMRALLFAKTKNENLNIAEFDKYAAQIGLDEKAFFLCLTNPEKSAKIEELNVEAKAYDILGAPTIFINNEMIPGARPYEDYTDSNGDQIKGLKTIIEEKIK